MRPVRHGMSHSPEFRIWVTMMQRCTNPKAANYSRYGGRGISVCDRWRKFLNFYSDMGPRPTKSHSIERANVNGNYEPENCRWATPKEQARNRRYNHLVTVDGVTRTVTEWAEISGISRTAISNRIDRSWDPRRAVTEPASSYSRHEAIEFDGRSQTIPQWSKELSISQTTIRERLRRGWPTELVLSKSRFWRCTRSHQLIQSTVCCCDNYRTAVDRMTVQEEFDA